MKESIIWLLIKILFNKHKFKKILQSLKKDKIVEYKHKAIIEENYELAAYLEYYLEFKKENINQ